MRRDCLQSSSATRAPSWVLACKVCTGSVRGEKRCRRAVRVLQDDAGAHRAAADVGAGDSAADGGRQEASQRSVPATRLDALRALLASRGRVRCRGCVRSGARGANRGESARLHACTYGCPAASRAPSLGARLAQCRLRLWQWR
ncbi:hypothetical protein L1887_53216 [Cichorium endivia]|nr:hypothetical protein L1887_53216 [Cichorium endivia]